MFESLELTTDGGEVLRTIDLDGCVQGIFSEVIHDVYTNSYDNADFIL